MISQYNSYDYTRNTSLPFTGVYETNLENKVININIYTENQDTLTIYYTNDPNGTPLITETYIINNLSCNTTITSTIKSRFVKIGITSGVTTGKRIYDVTYITNENTQYVVKPRGSGIFWNNATVITNELSNAINLSSSPTSNLTIYGTSSNNVTICLQFSNDGVTYYNTQYTYAISVNDFGFNIVAAPNYIRLITNGATTITAILNYS
jgi:hypothetical protein